MENFSLFVGLDIGKSSFHAAFRSVDGLVKEACYQNNAKGISGLLQDICSYGYPKTRILIAMEHCGVYLEKIVWTLVDQDLFVWLWNPLIASRAPLALTRHKNDPKDAKAMASLAHIHQSKAKRYFPPNKQQQEIKTLFNLRSQLIKHRTQFINQQKNNQDKAMPHPLSDQYFEEMVENLSRKIKEVDKKLEALIFQSKRLKRIYQILRSIPAIGPVTALQLIIITQGFTQFHSERALAKYIGTMPLKYDSGTSIRRRPRSSKKAHKSLKVNLTMGATSLIREGLFFHQFYRFKTQNQKMEHFKVINIIRNTIIKLAFKLVRLDQEFDPNIFIQNKKSWQNFLTLS